MSKAAAAIIPASTVDASTTPDPNASRDLTQPQAPRALDIENEADHQIRLMIARRKPGVAADEPKVEVKDVTPAVTPPAVSADVGDLLADALKFRPSKKPDAKVDKPDATPAKKDETPATDPKEGKTVVRRKVQPVAVDPAKVAAAAATAATAEAVKAMGGRGRGDAEAHADPALGLPESDRMEFEVVKFMADTDPKFKGADAIFLSNIKKTERYAESWEARNPGKAFDPEDDEHNEFFASVKQPYSPQELRRAEARMEARSEAAKASAKQDEKTREKLSTLESENARLKLAPTLQSTLQQAIGQLATSLGDDVVASLRAGGPQKLQEDDPVVEEKLREAINAVSPVVQAIVEIESSDGLIEFDAKNPSHAAYADLLAQKEAEFAGVVDERGRACVSRSEYMQMSQAQRAGYFFLTPQNIIAELVNDQVEATKTRIDSERNRIAKAAERMGYTKTAATNGAPSAAQATTPKKDLPKDLGSPTAIKPVSPSSTTGAKIDVKDPAPGTKTDQILEKVGGILFGR